MSISMYFAVSWIEPRLKINESAPEWSEDRTGPKDVSFFYQRRRVELKDKANYRRCWLGGGGWEFIQLLATLAVFAIGRFWRIGWIHPFLSNHTGAIHPIIQNRPICKTVSAARNWINWIELNWRKKPLPFILSLSYSFNF